MATRRELLELASHDLLVIEAESLALVKKSRAARQLLRGRAVFAWSLTPIPFR